MASETQANTPARHPLQRSVSLTWILSVVFPHVYDAVWLSRVYDYYPSKRGHSLPPLWPIYIGATLFVLLVSVCLFEITILLGNKIGVNVQLFYHIKDIVYTFGQLTTFPLRIYGTIIICKLFPKKKSMFLHIISLMLAFFFPSAVGQYKINNMLVKRHGK